MAKTEKKCISTTFLYVERCRRTLAYILQTNNIILIKFQHVLHNEMTNHLQFLDLEYLEIWPFYRLNKI